MSGAKTTPRTKLIEPIGLAAALTEIFTDFGDYEFRETLMSSDCTAHAVMIELSTYFNATLETHNQLERLAFLICECVSVEDKLENAIGTCFLEHLS